MRLLTRIVVIGAAGAALVSTLGLMGWITGSQLLTNFGAGMVPIAPSTSVAILALSAILLAHFRWGCLGRCSYASAAIVAVVAAFGLLILFEGMMGTGSELEDALLPGFGMWEGLPAGRMSPASGGLLFLAGLSILLLIPQTDRASRRRWSGDFAGGLATVVLALSLAIVTAHLYCAPGMYGAGVIPVALPSAIALASLAAAVAMAAGPASFPARWFLGSSVRAQLMRAFTPVVMLWGLIDLALGQSVYSHPGLDRVWLEVGLVMVLMTATAAIISLLSHRVGHALERTAQALGESEERFRSISQSASDAIITIDSHSRIVFWNKAAESIFGFPAGEIIGKSLDVIMPHRFHELHRNGVERITSIGQSRLIGTTVEVAGIRRDGREIPVELSLAEWKTTESVFFTGIARDISRRKETEQRLLRVTMAVEASLEGMAITDVNRTPVYFNPAFVELFGYSVDDMKDSEAWAWLYKDPEDRAKIVAALMAGKSWSGTPTMVSRSGREIPVLERVTPLRDAAGGIAGSIGIFSDVTEQQRTREQLEKLSAAVENSPVAVVITDTGGGIEYVNSAFAESTGYSRDEVLGTDAGAMLSGEMPPEMYADLLRAVGSGRKWKGRLPTRRKSGELYWVSSSFSPIRDAEGRITHFVGMQEDISALKRAEKELVWAKEGAEAANRAKSEFLASMSHEIRTPLNAIIGASDLLSEMDPTEDQAKYLDLLRTAGGSLLDLINDVLDLSKIEAGHLSLESAPFDLEELMERTCDVGAVRARAKGLELACRLSPDCPTLLVGDATRLQQALTNLIGNAVKFTERGEVVVEVRPADTAKRPNGKAGLEMVRLLFSVRDTGIGIPKDKLDAVFERFTQADSSTTRKYGGTGLGLAITQRLVGLMGGTIWVESEVGMGSSFLFTIEVPTTSAPISREATPEADLRGLRVLVVDDSATNRLIVGEILAGWGAEVEQSPDGVGAIVRLVQASEQGAPFRLALIDYHMPGMDGFELATRIKGMPSLGGVTVIMLASDSRGGDATRRKEAGVARFMVKPIKRAELKAVIDSALYESKKRVVTAPVDGASVAGRALRILLAEDSPPNRVLIEAFLRNSPHSLTMAEDGAAAVELFKAGEYDLVLMDMQMPVMDGYEATREIRRWEVETNRRPVPIAALTAHAMKEYLDKSLEAGCTAYLTKPIRKAVLLEAIDAYAQPVQGEPSTGVGEGEEREAVLVDPSIAELVPKFLETVRGYVDTLEGGLERGDMEAIQILGHNMKGTGGGYGFDRITEIGGAIERAAKTRDAGAIERSVAELSSYLRRVEVVVG